MRAIVGVGVDAVPVAKMRRALERTPGLAERVFTPHELRTAAGRGSREASLAARFAAKEAVRKAMGRSIPWRDIEVRSDDRRRPQLRLASVEGVRFHVSLTHTDDVAVAVVVGEAEEPSR